MPFVPPALGPGLILSTVLFTAVASTTQCYYANGSYAPNNIVPCWNNSTHAACCNAANGDICMTSGLCVSPNLSPSNGLIWANGCTDQSGTDPSCQQYCRGLLIYLLYLPSPSGLLLTAVNPARDAQYVRLQPCDNGSWCCNDPTVSYNTSEGCCNDSSLTFKLTLGNVVTQLSLAASTTSPTPSPTNTTTPNPSSCPTDKTTVVGASVGAVLGAVLVCSLAVILILFRRLRHIEREYDNRWEKDRNSGAVLGSDAQIPRHPSV
jgi:hypothetical protein